jgi:hypothetical protein
MMCGSCAKLAFLYTKKQCIRCQGEVIVTIAVLCEFCSLTNKICSVCLKKTQSVAAVRGGCGCGGKK